MTRSQTEGNKIVKPICKQCDFPLRSKKEHKEGYCRYCLIPHVIIKLNEIHIRREKLAEENNSLKIANPVDSLSPYSPSDILSLNFVNSTNSASSRIQKRNQTREGKI